MPIGEVSAAASASDYNVKLQNKQSEQETKVANTILTAAAETAPPAQSRSSTSRVLDISA